MKNIMIDIETLGTKPGSIITSVGAVAFDAQGRREEIEVYLSVDDALKRGFTVDASTLRFWAQQPTALLQKQLAEAPPVAAGLNRLRTFIDDVRGAPGEKLRVWANAPTFDLVMLREYYQRYGQITPWHYREEFDQRTFAFLMDMPRHETPNGNLMSTEQDHDALDDARSQARATLSMLKRLAQLQDIALREDQ